MGLPQANDLFKVNVGGTQGVAGTGTNYSVKWSEMLAAIAALHYTQAQVDDLVMAKANVADVYTITQTDNAIAAAITALTLGTAAQANTGDFATVAQGVLADNALPAGNFNKANVDALGVNATHLGGQLPAHYLAYGNLTGVPTTFAPSAHVHAAGDVTTGTFGDARIAETNVTQHQAALSIGWSQLTSIPTDVSNIAALLGAKAPLTSPALIGTPTAPTAAPDTNSTQIATTAYVDEAVIAAGGYNSTAFAADLATKDTDDLTEGVTNLYYTNARVGAYVTKAFVDALGINATQLGGQAGSYYLAYENLTGVPSTFAPSAHTHAIVDVTGLQTALDGKVASSLLGAAGGVATLDGSGLVPASQLPSFVDDVIEAANYAALPGTGETGKIYVALDTGRTYRWSGSTYTEILASPGTTDNVTEGATNLYYTNARVAAYVTKAYVDALSINAAQLGGYAIGTSGAAVPLMNTSNTWSAAQIIQNAAGGDPLQVKTTSATTNATIAKFLSSTDRSLAILQPNTADANDPFVFSTANAFLFKVDAVDAFLIDAGGVLYANGNAILDTGDIGTSGAVLPYLNGLNTWGAAQSHDAAIIMNGTNPVRWGDYGGGWYMSDTSWIRAYGSKNIYTSGNIRTDGEFQIGNNGANFRATASVLTHNGNEILRDDMSVSTQVVIDVKDADFILQDSTDGTNNWLWRDHSAASLFLGTSAAVVHFRSNVYLDSTYNLTVGGSITAGGNAVLTTASSVNASQLSGQSLVDSAATGATVAGRNGSGDIFARLIRQTYADQATISGGMVFRINNSTDNYLRVCNDVAAIRTYLGVGTSDTPTLSGLIVASGPSSTITLDNSSSSAYDVRLQTGYDVDGWFRVIDGTGAVRFSVGRDGNCYNGLGGTGYALLDANDIGTSGAVIPLLNGANVWSGHQRFNDNVYLRMGTGNDVDMFWNGTNLYMDFQVANTYLYLRNVANSNIFSFNMATGEGIATGDWTKSSDRRMKDKIETVESCKIFDMRGVRYRMKDTGVRSAGIIAQELQRIAPELVRQDGRKMRRVVYDGLHAYTIEGMKALRDENKSLRKELRSLRRDVDKLLKAV